MDCSNSQKQARRPINFLECGAQLAFIFYSKNQVWYSIKPHSTEYVHSHDDNMRTIIQKLETIVPDKSQTIPKPKHQSANDAKEGVCRDELQINFIKIPQRGHGDCWYVIDEENGHYPNEKTL